MTAVNLYCKTLANVTDPIYVPLRSSDGKRHINEFHTLNENKSSNIE